MTSLCAEAQAPSWLPSGRDWKYSSDSAALVFSDAAADPNLAFELHPKEIERHARIGRELFAFGALVVGEEDEAALAHSFEQNDAHVRHAIGRSGGETHGVDVTNLRGGRFREPLRELLDRIGRQIGAPQTMRDVIVTEGGDIERR